MKPVHDFIVTAHLPERIATLKELAYNYWWCWNSEAKELFVRINRELWEEVNHNPVQMINKLPIEKLNRLAEQTDFTSFLDYIYKKFKNYMSSTTWYDKIEDKPSGTVAYFSTEYGINESFPNYSGGLGILSGDHLKSASDLGLNLIGVGLLYQQGYFRQRLTQHGWQNEYYPYNDFYSMPLILEKNAEGETLLIEVDLPKEKAWAQIWRMQIGRVPLYLLDTNISQNVLDEYRDITDQLYGGTRETRIQQEIILGIGGMRALKALNLLPEAVHINEGHAAFALLERTFMYMQKYNLDFRSAKQITKATSVFTTHTPVPAGNESFKVQRMEDYFHNYYANLGLSKEYFFRLGQIDENNPNEDFSMTVLGLKLTSYHNGVSKLHGEVSRKMWQNIWKCFPTDEIPIQHITNGIHTMTWVAREFTELFDRYFSPKWRTEIDNQAIWDKIDTIPSEELWREKTRRRVRLVLFAREYLKRRQKGYLPPEQVSKINEYLDPDALTIGFARRFATYKRATLLFTDMERLATILKKFDKPVQIVLAGKAHPHDVQGKEVIQSIIQKVREYNLERHVVFLEDYDTVIARYMVKGCDVWLNTPVRPMEASGTSGMKAALNGCLNFSILDGWWDEAFNGKNGFSIGHGEEYDNFDEQNIVEAGALYDMLEQVIIPMFYDREKSNKTPEKWVTFIKENIRTIAGQFSSERMVKDYANMFYMNALRNYGVLTENNAESATKFKEWKDKVRSEWANVEIMDVSMEENGENYIGKPIKVSATVTLGNLTPDDVIVQVYYGSVDHLGELVKTQVEKLSLVNSEGKSHFYEGSYTCSDTGVQGFTVRVLPTHPLMVCPSELYICAWAQ
ncbi:glycosyltransferase family 1 protein [Bacteroidetes/Chlorobi group bacterium ChocPot_Mid]|nr:MAG: glycosyltransferase family 1 protein [Bacteroidetes/Chlorobi group bacterium ChocPot_Mid]